MNQISLFDTLPTFQDAAGKKDCTREISAEGEIDKYKPGRSGIKDIWNAFMLHGAEFKDGDMPLCLTTAASSPDHLISWTQAQKLHKTETGRNHGHYTCNAFVHFYEDDDAFDDRANSIWLYPKKALKVLKHFAGIIAPDFSTYVDFPDPLKRWNFYRMNAFALWVSLQGIPIIVNARWGGPETWEYCWNSIRPGDMIAIGTVASGINKRINRPLFEAGFLELINRKHPSTILVYGSASNRVFNVARKQGIKVISFPSETNIRMARRRAHE